jgi:hypothetical protein
MATEATKITLSRDYETNGEVIPAGTHELPTALANDLARREEQYQKYHNGITEKHEYPSKAGQISMGSGE